MIWALWFLLLVAQNASFTLVSRARNSSSISYHAWASVLSNGVWFVSQFILFDSMLKAMADPDLLKIGAIGLVYTAGTMTGSLAMHWFALHKIEKKSVAPTPSLPRAERRRAYREGWRATIGSGKQPR